MSDAGDQTREAHRPVAAARVAGGAQPDADLAAENRLLSRIIEATTADLDVRDVARRVAALVTDATSSDVCFVHLVDEGRQRLVLTGATPPFDELVGSIELNVGEGIAGWVAAHAEPAVVPDKWSDPRYRYIPALRGEEFAAMISVPLLVRGGRVVGVLNAHTRAPRIYEENDVAVLTRVAGLLAQAVENARLHHTVAQREEALERFAARIVDAQELERRRLAGEIHDGISQRLISLWYHLAAGEDQADDPDAVRRELSVARNLASAALDEARAAIGALRPLLLDDLGLGPSLESLARSVAGVEADVVVEPCHLAPHVEVALYRIAQEALQNVTKHAAASRVSVSLVWEDGAGARLVIADDGRGLPPQDAATLEARGAYGLQGMAERAELIGGTLHVTSSPGGGTRVEVFVPRSDSLEAPAGR